MSPQITSYRLVDAAPAAQVPLVLDSPHSGRWLPPELAMLPNPDDGAAVEDRHVDELFTFVPELGGALLAATVSRRYIDLNRHPDSVGDNPEGALIRPWPGQPDPLPADQRAARLAAVWQPYHDELARLLAGRHRRFGRVLHLNLHSMPGSTRDSRGLCPDIVLGNRDGQSCSPALLQGLAQQCRRQGLAVALNDPYSGVEILRRYGNPAAGVHSVQMEISRALFLDEMTGERNSNFTATRGLLCRIMTDLIRPHVASLAAE